MALSLSITKNLLNYYLILLLCDFLKTVGLSLYRTPIKQCLKTGKTIILQNFWKTKNIWLFRQPPAHRSIIKKPPVNNKMTSTPTAEMQEKMWEPILLKIPRLNNLETTNKKYCNTLSSHWCISSYNTEKIITSSLYRERN